MRTKGGLVATYGRSPWKGVDKGRFTHGAQENVQETGADVRRDIDSLRDGRMSRESLMAWCLSGSEGGSRTRGWKEYVATCEAIAAEKPWTFNGFCDTVFGVSGPTLAAEEALGLDIVFREKVEAWCRAAEAEAWRVGGLGGAPPPEWEDYHRRVVAHLCD